MLANLSDMAILGITPTERANIVLQDESTCAICGAPPMPEGDQAILHWCQRYDPENFPAIRENVTRGDVDDDDDERFGGRSGGVGGYVSRLRYDSKLALGIPMTLDDLEQLLRVAPECQDMLEETFVVWICGRCSTKNVGSSDISDLLAAIIINRFGDGNERAARAQPVWEQYEHLVQALQTIRMEGDGAA